ncbi:hypothetical protein KRX54_06835 [Actinomycetaceae bacterium TAE3-ERU4]|nr:hypothetical protein [Actinomycetaceae bacterium TAE3-ERU4]
MLYDNATRVIHVNNVAQVPQTLVSAARQAGRSWVLHKIPPASPTPKALKARYEDAKSWFPGRRAGEIIHVHYAPNGYYFWGAKAKKVLHFHGTDARIDSTQPIKRELIKISIAQADAIAYSTPDLKEHLKKLTDRAVYLPNPAPPIPPDLPEAIRGRIVFNTRWDESKGGLSLVRAAQLLVRNGYEVIGFNWGVYAPQAKAAGVKLLPLMSQDKFTKLLSSGELIVGQVEFPALSISDMQSLATGRPLIAIGPSEECPIIRATRKNLSEVCLEAARTLMGSSSPAPRTWLETHHGVKHCLKQWEKLYGAL